MLAFIYFNRAFKYVISILIFPCDINACVTCQCLATFHLELKCVCMYYPNNWRWRPPSERVVKHWGIELLCAETVSNYQGENIESHQMEIMSCPSYPSCLTFCNSRHEYHPRNRNSLLSVLSLLFHFWIKGMGKRLFAVEISMSWEKYSMWGKTLAFDTMAIYNLQIL